MSSAVRDCGLGVCDCEDRRRHGGGAVPHERGGLLGCGKCLLGRFFLHEKKKALPPIIFYLRGIWWRTFGRIGITILGNTAFQSGKVERK